ncbi:uncharacterized protein LOC129967129 [Argiope bruennichi]|uniref:uncharacterized protein LOC129967129 n=1 Tax=Argiope bruennichi TaxID=94029 RepID=UPI002494449F|nr:uncharacterized protein LOC129967129 [Argiope bruennichi]
MNPFLTTQLGKLAWDDFLRILVKIYRKRKNSHNFFDVTPLSYFYGGLHRDSVGESSSAIGRCLSCLPTHLLLQPPTRFLSRARNKKRTRLSIKLTTIVPLDGPQHLEKIRSSSHPG